MREFEPSAYASTRLRSTTPGRQSATVPGRLVDPPETRTRLMVTRPP